MSRKSYVRRSLYEEVSFASVRRGRIQGKEGLDLIHSQRLTHSTQYSHAHAPYEYLNIPLDPISLSNSPAFPSDPHPQALIEPAERVPAPTPRATPLLHFSTPLSFPILSQAAVLLWFTLRQDRPVPSFLDTDEDVIASGAELLETYRQHVLFASVSTINAGREFFEKSDSFTPDYMRVRYASIAKSKRWDGEWARLVGCNDPTRTKQVGALEYRYAPGQMTGCWDGRLLVCVSPPLLYFPFSD